MSPRRRVISDPGEIASLVLDTPGMVDKLADALADVVPQDERDTVRASVRTSLEELAADFAIKRLTKGLRP